MRMHGIHTTRWSRINMGAGLLLAVWATAQGAATAQTCTHNWSEQFALAGTTAQISDTSIWDDGTGPALYAVGNFPNRMIGRIDQIIDSSDPDNVLVSGAYNIARWDGRNWNIVGPTPILQTDATFALSRMNTIQAFDPDGPGPEGESLIVGGVTNNSSPNRHSVLKFNGTTWSTFGSNIASTTSEEVRDLEIFQGELYACGRINSVGLAGVAKWDVVSQDWVDVGGGIPTVSTNIRAERMAVGDADGDGTPELYVSGTFTFSATGGSAVKLAKWNGSNWARVTGFTGTSTTNAANLGGPSVLKFIDIGDGPALLVGDAIYTGLVSPANTRGVALARLKNGVWSTLLAQTATGTTKAYVYTAELFDGPAGSQLHIGGLRVLDGVAGQPTRVSLARRTATGTFEPLGTFPTSPTAASGTVAWMRPLDWDGPGPGDSKLLFGATQFRWGTIGSLSGLEPLGMALWNGSAVELAHSGSAPLALVPGMIKELDPDGTGPLPTALYIGHFTDVVAGVPSAGLVTFNGTSYQSTPLGITDVVAAEPFTPASGTTSLYAAGELPNSNGPALVRLDGSSWTTIAQPSFDENETQPQGIDALTTATVAGEPSLIVSGRFRELGGIASRFAIRFNGTSWVAMDAGLPAPPAIPNPNELFRVNNFATRVVNLGGELFTTAQASVFDLTTSTETVQPARFYRWNGAAWQDIGPGEGRLSILDLGTGPRMYSIRNYQPSGSDNSFIAEWNGTAFVQIGPGFNWASPLASRSNIQSVGAHDFGLGKRIVVVLDGPGTSNSAPVSGLLYLDGGQWHQVPGGERLIQSPTLYSSSNPAWSGLYVGGGFRVVNGNASNRNNIESQGIARLITTCTCRADFNGVGGVTIDDLFLYINAYFLSLPTADFNGVGGVTIDDLFLYINAYFVGC